MNFSLICTISTHYTPQPTLGLGLNNAQDITTTQLSGASLQEFLKSLGGSDDAAKLLKQYSWK